MPHFVRYLSVAFNLPDDPMLRIQHSNHLIRKRLWKNNKTRNPYITLHNASHTHTHTPYRCRTCNMKQSRIVSLPPSPCVKRGRTLWSHWLIALAFYSRSHFTCVVDLILPIHCSQRDVARVECNMWWC